MTTDLSTQGYTDLGLAKEVESLENPGGLERRVALIPSDVAGLVCGGINVSVEAGAGEGVGYSDAEYQIAGANLVVGDAVYADKDMVVKLKGPSQDAIRLLRPGSTLLCMAHVGSFPQRLALCKERDITLIAMEQIVESPERVDDMWLIGRWAMGRACYMAGEHRYDREIHIVGFSERLRGVIQTAARSNPCALFVHRLGSSLSSVPWTTCS